MARFTIEIPAAPKGGRYVPEMEQEQAPASNTPTGMREKLADMQEPSMIDTILSKLPGGNLRGSAVGGYMMGAADLPVGAAQLAANLVGQGEPINKAIQAKELEYQDRRAAAGRDGFDAGRLAGNVAGPALLIGGVGSGMGATARGATQGAIGGAAQPVTDGGDSFFADKAIQTTVGTVAGGVMGRIFDSLSNSLSSFVGRMRQQNRGPDPAAIDAQIRHAFQREGIDPAQIPEGILQTVRRDIAAAMRTGQRLDPAALARQLDFEALGMRGTLGQITRDPSQFAREKNLSGIEDAGEALVQRFSEQPRQLQGAMGRLGSANAAEPPVDSATVIGALRANDAARRTAVDDAYRAARQSNENALDVPMNRLAQEFGGMRNRLDMSLLPGPVRQRLESFGLMDGGQRRAFTLDDAEDLIQTININYNPAAGPQARALNSLRTAINADIDSVAQAGNAAGLWRGAARLHSQRMRGLEGNPALAAAVDDVAPDTFMQRYVFGAPVRDVRALAQEVAENPEAVGAIRGQVARHLESKAFGANAAGDKGFSQESFNKELRKIGREKLLAIFPPEDVDTLFQIGRVGAYISSQPAGAVVNNSGTAAAVMNLVSRTRGIPYLREIVRPLETAIAQREAAAAASGAVPATPIPFNSPTVDRVRNRLAGPVALGAGAMATPRQER